MFYVLGKLRCAVMCHVVLYCLNELNIMEQVFAGCWANIDGAWLMVWSRNEIKCPPPYSINIRIDKWNDKLSEFN